MPIKKAARILAAIVPIGKSRVIFLPRIWHPSLAKAPNPPVTKTAAINVGIFFLHTVKILFNILYAKTQATNAT